MALGNTATEVNPEGTKRGLPGREGHSGIQKYASRWLKKILDIYRPKIYCGFQVTLL